MASGKSYDNHTLYIKCDCATSAQITEALNESISTYQRTNGVNLNCRFRVNLVENKEGKSFGIAFVFVTNPAVYYMLQCKNPDGTDRVEYIDDPSWIPPVQGESTNESGWSSIAPPVYTPGMSWADISDLQSEYDEKVKEHELSLTCPKIAIQLEPLMRLLPYKLSPEQMEQKRAKIIADNEGKPDFNPDLVKVEPEAFFCVDRAMVVPVDPKYMPNILKSKDIPLWVTKEDLKAQFVPYASDSKTLQERYIKGRKIEESYPFVNINNDRVGFVIFDPSTHDAQFALHMMKKTFIRKKVKENGKEQLLQSLLIFGHSYRTDRDMMADINLQPRPFKGKGKK